MNLSIVLAVLSLALFLFYFFYSGGQRKHYLLAVVYLFPFLSLGVTPFAFGGLSVFDIISYIAFFLFFRDFIFIGKTNLSILWLIVVFIILLFISSFASEFPTRSMFGVFSVIPPFIYARLLLKEIKEDNTIIMKIITGLKFSFYIAAGFILIQIVIGPSFTFYPSLNQNVLNNDSVRYPGFFMDSQINGLYLSLVSFLFLYNTGNPKSPKFKNFLCFGFATLLVILSGSRSALIGQLAGLLVLLIGIGGNFRITTLSFGIVILMILLFFSDSIVMFQRFKTIDDSYSFRASIWEGAWEIYKKHPALGIGINNYQDYVKLHSQDQFLLLDNDEIFYLDQPENGYLKILTEYGLLASLTLLLIFISPMVSFIRRFINGKKIFYGFFFLAPVFAWFVSFTSVYSLSDSRIELLLTCYLTLLISIPEYQPPVYDDEE